MNIKVISETLHRIVKIEYVKGDLKLEANCKLNYLEGDILSIETYVDIINYSFKNKSINRDIFLPLYKIEINDNTSLNYSEVLDNLKSEIKNFINIQYPTLSDLNMLHNVKR